MARLEKLMRTHFDHEVELMEEAAGRMCNWNGHEHQMLLSLYDQASGLSRFMTVLYINTNGKIAAC